MTATRSPAEDASAAAEVTAEPVEAAMTEVAVEEATEEPEPEVTVEVVVEPEVVETAEAVVEDTAEPIVEATAEETVEATEEPEPEATVEVIVEPEVVETAEAVVEGTAEPLVEATAEETVEEATAEPTAEAMAEATEEPTPEVTVEATVEPTVEPTAEPADTAAAAEAPDIIFPADNADVILGELTVIGTGEPGTEVELVDNGTVLDVVTVDSDGEWTYTFEPAEGDHQFSARIPGEEAAPGAEVDLQAVSPSADYDCDSNPGLVREDSYIVGTCDTLVDVSEQLGIEFEALSAANPEIDEPDLIYPGQELTLPQ
jgi:hypothetical protein